MDPTMTTPLPGPGLPPSVTPVVPAWLAACPQCGRPNPENRKHCPQCQFAFPPNTAPRSKVRVDPYAVPSAAARPATSGNAVTDFFAFRTLISHGLIRLVYILGLLALVAGSGFLLVQGDIVNGLLLLLGGNLGWRMLCEGIILFFSMHARLVAIERAVEQR